MGLQVGDRIVAIRNGNPARRQYPGRVTGLGQGSVPGAGSHWYSERALLCYYCCCWFACCPRQQFYDIEYDDGEKEQSVPSELVFPAVR